MKQKFTTRVSRLLKISFLVSFLLVGVFGLGLQDNYKAQATLNVCGFDINFNAASTVQLNQPLSLNVVLKVTPGVSNVPLACISKVATLVIWDSNASGVNGNTVPALTYCYISISNIYNGTYTLSDCAQVPKFVVSAQYYKAGYTFNLHAGVYAGQLDSPIYPGAQSFDREASPVSVTVAGSSGTGTCQTNSDCASKGVGFVCNSSKACVEASNFSCTNGNSTQCPSGLKCINNNCLESCSGGSCSWADETCDTKTGSPTYQYCTTSNGAGPTAPPSTQTPPASTPPVTKAADTNSVTQLYNPIDGSEDLTKLVVSIMQGFLAIIGIWAVAFIVIGGFRMVISSGNEEQVLAAKKTITWAILGVLVAVLSFAIIAIVQNLVGVKVAPPATPTSTIITTVTKV